MNNNLIEFPKIYDYIQKQKKEKEQCLNARLCAFLYNNQSDQTDPPADKSLNKPFFLKPINYYQ